MSIKISGILPGPTGEPAAHIGITLRAIKTSLTVITTLESNSITGTDGAYSLNVEPGQYDVLLWVDGINARNVGTITVYSDSLPGTLNNFLTAMREEDGTPEIIRQLEQLRAEALQAALEANASKDEATHQAGVATNAAENAAQETTDLIKAAVKADADRAESARNGAETAQSTVNTQAAEVALHHTEVGQLASAASNSAALAAASSNSAAQSASESESSKNAAAQSELSALAGVVAAGKSATAAAGDKTAAKGFRDEAEEFAASAKASAESIDVSALEEQINQKVSQTEFDDAIADKASNQALTDGLATKASTQQLTDGLAGKASTQQLTDGLSGKAANGANGDITQLNALTKAITIEQGGTGAPDAAGARTNLELGDAAVCNVGTTAGTVAAGDDSRFKNSELFTYLYPGGSAAAPATLGLSQRIVLDNPFTGRKIDYRCEVRFGGIWGVAGYGSNVGSGVFSAGALAIPWGDNIVIWSGVSFILHVAYMTANSFPSAVSITSAPYRVAVWTID